MADPAGARVDALVPAVAPGWSRRYRNSIAVAIEVVVLLGLWELAGGPLHWVNPVFVPPPSAVVRGFEELLDADLVSQALYSYQNFLTGFLLAAIVGVTVGIVVGSVMPLRRLLGPLAWTLYAMPLVAIRPMTTIWFGFGAAPIVFLVFVSALFPVLLNTMSGVGSVDPSLLRAGRVFGGGRVELWRKIVLPATIPFILTGLRLAVVSGFIGLIVSELVGSPKGFGAIVSIASSRYRVNEAFAVIVIVVASSVTLVRLVGSLERRVSVWRTNAT